MHAEPSRSPVKVVLDTAAGPVLATVDPRLYDLRESDAGVDVVPLGLLADDLGPHACARGHLLADAPPGDDVTRPPVTGLQVARLRPVELAVVADGWACDIARARAAAPAAGAGELDLADGHARVLRALAADVPVLSSPTWSEFVAANAAGLLSTPAPQPVPTAAPHASPLGAQLSQREQVLAVLAAREGVLPSADLTGERTTPRVFAGLTVAAALVLTGCGSDPVADDRRCVTGDGTVVDDDLCDDDGGGGGGYFFLYGGSTYIRDGKTYVRGGSTVAPPRGSFGGRSSSGGG